MVLRAQYPEGAERGRGVKRDLIVASALVAVLVAIVIVETHWPNLLLFGGVKPDLMLLLVLYFSFSEGPAKAIGVGLVGGFLQDIFSLGLVGLNIFCKVLLGYTVGVVSTRLVTEHPVVMTSIAFLSTICQAALFVLLSFLHRDEVPVKLMFVHVGVPTAFYTSVLAPACFYCMDRLWRKVGEHAG